CLFLAWLLGAGVCAARIGVEGWTARRIRRRSLALPDPWLSERLPGLGWRLGTDPGTARPPELLLAQGGGSPALTRPLRPAILLPEDLMHACAASELQLILGHELAHLKRRDLFWGWVPALAHVFFFFHPLVWLANEEYRAAQEMACDELAVRATATRPA